MFFVTEVYAVIQRFNEDQECKILSGFVQLSHLSYVAMIV